MTSISSAPSTRRARMGWEPVVGAHVLERTSYLAGSDAHRLADLNHARDRRYDRRASGAFAAATARCVCSTASTTTHGANGRERSSDIRTSRRCTRRSANAPISSRFTDRPRARRSRRFSASIARAAVAGDDAIRSERPRGRNAPRRVARAAASRAEISRSSRRSPERRTRRRSTARILVLEDVNESVYRIDRMLTQLRLSGALDRVAGIAFGQFTDIPPADDANGESRPLADLLQRGGRSMRRSVSR